MNFSRLSSSVLPLKAPFFYGWIIVFIAALGLFFSGPGQTFTISIFINEYSTQFGWSDTLISSMYTIATLCSGILLLIVGKTIDRFGQRKMMVLIATLLAVACLFNSFIMGPVMLLIGFFMLRLFGQGGMVLVPNTLVPQWFIAKRGRAMAFMGFGVTVSSAVMPPLNAWLIGMWGWEWTWRIWAMLLIGVFVPLAFFLVRNLPEMVGLRPDGVNKILRKTETTKLMEAKSSEERPVSEASVNAKPSEEMIVSEDFSEDSSKATVEEDWTLHEAMRTRSFWLLLYCVMVPALVSTGIVFHIVRMMGQSGISTASAALILTIMATVSFPVSFLAGFIVDKVRVHFVYAGVFVGYTVSMFILAFTETYTYAVLFGVVMGIGLGFQVVCQAVVWPNYFGRKHIGSIKGFTMTMMVIGSAFGPLPFALAFDRFGSYFEIILVMMLLPLLAVFAALASPAPTKRLNPPVPGSVGQ